MFFVIPIFVAVIFGSFFLFFLFWNLFFVLIVYLHVILLHQKILISKDRQSVQFSLNISTLVFPSMVYSHFPLYFHTQTLTRYYLISATVAHQISRTSRIKCALLKTRQIAFAYWTLMNHSQEGSWNSHFIEIRTSALIIFWHKASPHTHDSCYAMAQLTLEHFGCPFRLIAVCFEWRFSAISSTVNSLKTTHLEAGARPSAASMSVVSCQTHIPMSRINVCTTILVEAQLVVDLIDHTRLGMAFHNIADAKYCWSHLARSQKLTICIKWNVFSVLFTKCCFSPANHQLPYKHHFMYLFSVLNKL